MQVSTNQYSISPSLFQGFALDPPHGVCVFRLIIDGRSVAAFAVYSEFKLWTLDEIDAEPDPVWLVDGMFQENSFNIIVGQPGSKKSFIAQDIGSSVALGLPWLDQKVTQGDVIYIYAEGRKGLKFRAKAWKQSHDETTPSRMRIIDRAIDISNLTSVKQLVKAIRAEGLNPILIIIDTLARNFGDKDESKMLEMGAFVKGTDYLRETIDNCSVIVVHHTGWDGKHERGSSSLRGAADTVIKVVSDAKSKVGTITFEKIKDGDPEQFGKIKFELRSVELLSGGKSAVVQWRPSLDPDDVPTKPAAAAAPLDAKKRSILSTIMAAPNGATTRAELHRKTKTPFSTLDRQLKALKDMGKITQDEAKMYRAA